MFENLIQSAENNNVRRLSLFIFELKYVRKGAGSLLGLALICCLLDIGCASKKTSKDIMEDRNSSARPNGAAYLDNFYLDNRNPADRDVRNWDFFYKHCKLLGRENAAPNKADWDCTDPK